MFANTCSFRKNLYLSWDWTSDLQFHALFYQWSNLSQYLSFIQGVTGPHRQNDRDDRPCREDNFLWRNMYSQTCRLWVKRRWRCSPVRVGIEYKQLYTYNFIEIGLFSKYVSNSRPCASLHVWYRRSNDRSTRPNNRSSSSNPLFLLLPPKE